MNGVLRPGVYLLRHIFANILSRFIGCFAYPVTFHSPSPPSSLFSVSFFPSSCPSSLLPISSVLPPFPFSLNFIFSSSLSLSPFPTSFFSSPLSFVFYFPCLSFYSPFSLSLLRHSPFLPPSLFFPRSQLARIIDRLPCLLLSCSCVGSMFRPAYKQREFGVQVSGR